MKKAGNNGGFTLVELIVSLGILSVLCVAVLGFVSAGSGSYSSISTEISLQTESQTVMAQIREYLIDCNGGAAFKDGALCIADTDESGSVTEHVFGFDAAAGTLTYSKYDVAFDEGGPSKTLAESGLVSGRVTAFSAAFPEKGRAAVSTTLSVRGRSYSADQIIALRNSPAAAASEDALLAALAP